MSRKQILKQRIANLRKQLRQAETTLRESGPNHNTQRLLKSARQYIEGAMEDLMDAAEAEGGAYEEKCLEAFNQVYNGLEILKGAFFQHPVVKTTSPFSF